MELAYVCGNEMGHTRADAHLDDIEYLTLIGITGDRKIAKQVVLELGIHLPIEDEVKKDFVHPTDVGIVLFGDTNPQIRTTRKTINLTMERLRSIDSYVHQNGEPVGIKMIVHCGMLNLRYTDTEARVLFPGVPFLRANSADEAIQKIKRNLGFLKYQPGFDLLSEELVRREFQPLIEGLEEPVALPVRAGTKKVKIRKLRHIPGAEPVPA